MKRKIRGRFRRMPKPKQALYLLRNVFHSRSAATPLCFLPHTQSRKAGSKPLKHVPAFIPLSILMPERMSTRTGKVKKGKKTGLIPSIMPASPPIIIFPRAGKKAVYKAAKAAFQAVSSQHEGGLQDLILNVSQAYYRFLQSHHMEKAARTASLLDPIEALRNE